jgi:hypothetical protein
MPKEKTKNLLKNYFNPFYKGVCKMKPLRITMFLVAFLVLPLLLSQTMAATFSVLDSTWVPFAKISKNTTTPKALLGIQITGVTGCPSNCVESITLKSFVTKAFSVGSVQIYRESNGTKGLQVGTGSGYDQLVASRDTRTLQFDSNDTLTIGGIHDCGLVCSPDTNRFYVAVTAHHDSVAAYPSGYNGQCLEVVVLPTRLVLTNETNPDSLYNHYGDYNCATSFNPGQPGCRYKLCFDTQGPQYDIHLCVLEKAACYGDNTISQQDTVTICATNWSSDIATPITVIDSKKKFLLDLIQLKKTDNNQYGDSLGCWGGDKATPCDTSYNTVFIIPDKKNNTTYPGIDADTGQWELCFYAADSAGNQDTICIKHAPNLTWRIDTRKPDIDSVQIQLVYDANGDGIIALGDSIQVIGWGLSNPWQPELEVDSMIADMRQFCLGWVKLDDVLNNNRVFRKRIKMSVPCCIDTTDCDLNTITVWAWDNACNYDTLRKGYCGPVDLWQPGLSTVTYEYYFDYDTTFACIGIGDKVHIQAIATGSDIISVTGDMKDAGIDEQDRSAMPLPNKGGGVYDTIWTVTEPPILDGKDANNCNPPPTDANYSIKITACDDAGNCSTLVSSQLNRTLDTRVPRPIGFNCPDSVPCAIHPQSLPHGIIQLYWDRDCDECDAFYYYVYVSSDGGATWDSIGSTYDDEYGNHTFNFWHSEMLPDAYYQFKIKTEDDCGNVGPFSCAVGALADATPPNACIIYPDSGGTYGYPFPIKARSEDPDIESVGLWYRLWPNYPSDAGRSRWWPYGGDMDQYDDGFVFLEGDFFLHGYMGWVEVLPLSCDVIGNCQDTTLAYNDACLDNDIGELVPGHFLFYLDTTRCVVTVVSVNDTLSPQTSCGYNVNADIMNQVIINVPGAATGDTFTIDVRAIVDNSDHRIDYRNHVTMPCTLMVSVDNWDQGTQDLYVHVTNESNDWNCIPDPLVIELCVPPQQGPCVRIVDPVEWQRVPCSKTDKTNVCITAETIPGCGNETVTQVEFRVSATGEPPWYYIGEDITPISIGIDDTQIQDSWEVCWNNKEFIEQQALQDGDPVYLIAIGYDQYHVADTSHMVKVYLDCSSPNIQLLMEPMYYTCMDTTPKISCEPLTFKATVLDTMVDIKYVSFFAKKHSDPDIFDYWHEVGHHLDPFNANLWSYIWDHPCYCEVDDFTEQPPRWGLCSGLLYDFRIGAEDQADNEFLDYDEDGRFDDSTFNMAVALGAGITLMVDGDAPQPAISKVRDDGTGITIVNPSELLGGNDKAYVQGDHDITVDISVLPSEDTCEVMKVEYFLSIRGRDRFEGGEWNERWNNYVHVGTSTIPVHYPITFNPVAMGLIPPEMVQDGAWQGHLKAVLYDSLDNSAEDVIDLYILDVTPTQAVIIEPQNESYVSGDVELKVAAINDYEICKVCYQYRPASCPSDEDTCWKPVNEGLPNSCVTEEGRGREDDRGRRNFKLDWHTLNTIPDGEYYLRAIATDCDNNVDDDPHTIKVTVANELPTAVIDDPRVCSRPCADNPEDTLGYVGGTVELTATATSAVPVDHVTFMYKNRFEDADDWSEIDPPDYFPTNGKYSVLWETDEVGPDGKHHPKVSDGRYFLKARVYNAAGRYGDSDPIEVSIDNSGPFAQIISIDGSPIYDGEMDISLGQVIDIELVAIDSTSPYGWTRCYNSGLTDIQVCIDKCESEYAGDYQHRSVDTKCFDVSPVEDGFHHVQWNTSGLEFHGCSGCYVLYVYAVDCLGNWTVSDPISIYVYDNVAPITTIGGFDKYYDKERQDYLYAIYGYSNDKISELLFEYAPKGTDDWIPIGISSYVKKQCDLHLYKTSIDGKSLPDGDYWFRVISDDKCYNQNDSLAPIAEVRVSGGEITPYNPEVLGEMTFEKNWCVGGMHGIVRQTCSEGTPVVLAKYNSHDFECVDMQYHLQNTSDYAGDFYAEEIDHGGPAKFFSSVTVNYVVPPATGEPTTITYLRDGSFDVAEVSSNLGTHGIYQQGECPIEVTIQGGAVDHTEYLWVAPTELEWAPVTQPDIMPIGDPNGNATYISFTDCYYCCGSGGYATSWFGKNFGWNQTAPEKAAPMGAGGDGYGECCLNDGRYAKIKMCYDNTVNTDATHLMVMWWDCEDGEFKDHGIFYPATVEGFNTEAHTVEFATTCLNGPFAVVQRIERHCSGSIVVNMLDVEPYCKGYTNATPQFKAMITDNVDGTEGIDKHSIQFKADLFTPGDLVRIYDGSHYDDCHKWATGFGSFEGSGYDKVSGIFRAGWNDSTYLHSYNDDDEWQYCDQCYQSYYMGSYRTWCRPLYLLSEGAHMAVVTAMNEQIQTCSDTVNIMVDATKPHMAFADSVGAYVSKNPHVCIYFSDAKSGVDKSSIWVDLFEDDTSDPDPNNHSYVATIHPDQLMWVNDTTVCFDFTFENVVGGYLHIYVYGGPEWKCYDDCPSTSYYGYIGGVADCVGNRLGPFWRYYTVDAYGPTIALVECGSPLKYEIKDAMSGVGTVQVYEDGVLASGVITRDQVNPDYWWYTPSSGAHQAVIKATDYVGNVTNYSCSLPVDCAGPAVRFGDQYVCKNPTIELWITDPAGVDWTSVNVYITGCNESCYFLADDLGPYINTETGKITLSGCNLDCSDGNSIGVYVYSGTNYTGDGPKDVNGNHGKYRYCSFVVDAYPPVISGVRTGNSYEITITDAKSGVDWSSVKFYEDGVLLCEGLDCTDESVVFDTINGTISYNPGASGKEITITVTDKAGCNVATKVFTTEEDVLTFGTPHNSPNPFDPNDENTYIYPDLSKSAYVTIKIYDFAGEFVKTVC